MSGPTKIHFIRSQVVRGQWRFTPCGVQCSEDRNGPSDEFITMDNRRIEAVEDWGKVTCGRCLRSQPKPPRKRF